MSARGRSSGSNITGFKEDTIVELYPNDPNSLVKFIEANSLYDIDGKIVTHPLILGQIIQKEESNLYLVDILMSYSLDGAPRVIEPFIPMQLDANKLIVASDAHRKSLQSYEKIIEKGDFIEAPVRLDSKTTTNNNAKEESTSLPKSAAAQANKKVKHHHNTSSSATTKPKRINRKEQSYTQLAEKSIGYNVNIGDVEYKWKQVTSAVQLPQGDWKPLPSNFRDKYTKLKPPNTKYTGLVEQDKLYGNLGDLSEVQCLLMALEHAMSHLYTELGPDKRNKHSYSSEEEFAESLYRYIACLIQIRYSGLPDRTQNWTSNHGSPSLKDCGMSEHQFESFQRIFIQQVKDNKEALKRPFEFVGDVLEKVSESCRRTIRPGLFLPFDETGCGWHGRRTSKMAFHLHHQIYQNTAPPVTYDPNKPISEFWWVYELAAVSQSNANFLLFAQMRGSSHVTFNDEKFLSANEKVVLSSLVPYYFTWRVVVFDKYYSSVNLVIALFRRGLYAVGSMQSHRKHVDFDQLRHGLMEAGSSNGMYCDFPLEKDVEIYEFEKEKRDVIMNFELPKQVRVVLTSWRGPYHCKKLKKNFFVTISTYGTLDPGEPAHPASFYVKNNYGSYVPDSNSDSSEDEDDALEYIDRAKTAQGIPRPETTAIEQSKYGGDDVLNHIHQGLVAFVKCIKVRSHELRMIHFCLELLLAQGFAIFKEDCRNRRDDQKTLKVREYLLKVKDQLFTIADSIRSKNNNSALNNHSPTYGLRSDMGKKIKELEKSHVTVQLKSHGYYQDQPGVHRLRCRECHGQTSYYCVGPCTKPDLKNPHDIFAICHPTLTDRPCFKNHLRKLIENKQ